jgi:hypothetical protein
VKRWIIALAVALLPWIGGGASADEWNRQDIVFEATYLALHVVDWGQTLDIVERKDEYHERNVFLGKHPTRADVNKYFAATALLHIGIAHLLDRPARNYFQIGTIALEAVVINNNFQIGLKLNY